MTMSQIRIIIVGGVFVACLLVGIGRAQERITFTAPIASNAGIARMRPCRLLLDTKRPEVLIDLCESDATGAFMENGRELRRIYGPADAKNIITALNTANFSTKSLMRRIIERLQIDYPEFAGTIVGTPE